MKLVRAWPIGAFLTLVAAAQGGRWPDTESSRIPDGSPIAAIARSMTGLIHAAITDRKLTADPPGGSIDVLVWSSWIGGARRDDRLRLEVDPKRPPCWIEAAYQGNDFDIAFDDQRRLLLVTNCWEEWLRPILAISRSPSKRFTPDQLHCAWRAASANPGGYALDLEPPPAYQEEATPGAGAIEITLRFGSPDRRRGMLRHLGRRKLAKDEAESVRAALWDVDDEIRCRAAHLVLDSGESLGDAPVRAPLMLGPLLRLGDPEALATVTRLLMEAREQPWSAPHGVPEVASLLDHAAHGPPSLLPLIRPYLETQRRAVFAWAKLGGPMSEVEPLVDPAWIGCVLDELIEAGTPEAWKLVEAHPPACKGSADYHLLSRLYPYVVRNWDSRGSRLIRALGEPSGGCVEKLGAEMAFLFAGAGRSGAFADLAGIAWSEQSVHALCEFGAPICRSSDPRVVDILVSALLAAMAGLPGDDTGLGASATSLIANALGRRSAADRDRALALLERAPASGRGRSGSQMVQVRCALGEPPSPEALLTLGDTGFTTGCELTLVPWANRYSAVLPKLRADPRKHWFALTLLRDEESVPALVKWFEAPLDDPRVGWQAGLQPAARALQMMGGSEALDAFYRAARRPFQPHQINGLDAIVRAIAKLEAAGNWKRIAALHDPAVDPCRAALAAATRCFMK